MFSGKPVAYTIEVLEHHTVSGPGPWYRLRLVYAKTGLGNRRHTLSKERKTVEDYVARFYPGLPYTDKVP